MLQSCREGEELDECWGRTEKEGGQAGSTAQTPRLVLILVFPDRQRAIWQTQGQQEGGNKTKQQYLRCFVGGRVLTKKRAFRRCTLLISRQEFGPRNLVGSGLWRVVE